MDSTENEEKNLDLEKNMLNYINIEDGLPHMKKNLLLMWKITTIYYLEVLLVRVVNIILLLMTKRK